MRPEPPEKPTRRPGGIREMLSVALPMVVTLSCDTLMTFTDRWFLSRLGPNAMNAALGGGTFHFLSLTFFMGLIGYTNALVAQHYGAKQKAACSRVVTQGILVALAAWPLLLLLRPVAARVFALGGISTEQALLQTQFFNILVLGSGVGLARNALSGFFCGIGRTQVVMVSALAATAVNAFLNWVLIFGHLGFPALGIQGSAIGTLCGTLVGALILASVYFSRKIRETYVVLASFHLDRHLMRQLWRFGTPPGVEFFLNVLGFYAMISLFQAAGPATTTAATVLFNWDMVSFVPLVGVEIGVTSLVGRYVGARDLASCQASTRSGLSITWIYSAIVTVFFIAMPEPLVRLFEPPTLDPVFEAAVPTAVAFLRLAALYVLSEGFLLVYVGALRGAGDTFWTMCFVVSTQWIMVAAIFVTTRVFHASAVMGWAVAVAFFIPLPLLLRRRWNSGAWKRIQPLSSPPDPEGGEETQPLRDI